MFIPQLEVNPDQLFFFKDGDPVRDAFEKTEEVFGGATPLAGEFAFAPSRGLEGLAGITAVSRELEALPGIGPARARAILQARARRPFERVSELERAHGIGPATVEIDDPSSRARQQGPVVAAAGGQPLPGHVDRRSGLVRRRFSCGI